MVSVTKRDGRTEPFVPEKIVVSVVKSGAPADYARIIAQDIGGSAGTTIPSREIRTRVLAMLQEKNPAWEKNWTVYDTAVKKRTE